MAALNPTLYQHLQAARLGPVRISNPGSPAQIVYDTLSPGFRGRPRAHVIEHGEQYVISCPECSDTRGRLCISHRWGEVDDTGNDFLNLCYCFNEQCFATREAQERLHARIYPHGFHARELGLPPPPMIIPTFEPPRVFNLPENRPLSELEPQHRDYLERRGFSPEELESRYGARVCFEDPHSKPMITEPRLIIPVFAPLGCAHFSGSIRIELIRA